MKNKIVIGTWPLSGDFGTIKLCAAQEILERCREYGFHEFDTAPNYGNGFAEFCLGKIFADSEDILINTKIGNLPFRGKCFEIDTLRVSLEESLARLGRTDVNVLFLHNPRDDAGNYGELLGLMNELKTSGKIRAIGLSRARGFPYHKVVDLDAFDAVQDDVNLLCRPADVQGHSSRLVFMARSPLASGILSGKLTEETRFPPQDHRCSWLKGERLHSLLKRVDVIRGVSDGNVASLARRFVLFDDKIDKVIFGVKSPAHVDELQQDIEAGPLSRELVDKLTSLYQNDYNLIGEEHLNY